MAKGKREFTQAENTALKMFLGLMAEAQMNPQDLTNAAGVSYSTAENWVKGNRWPRSDTLAKIEAAVDARLRDLGRGNLPPGSVNQWKRGQGLPGQAPDLAVDLSEFSSVELAREILRRLEALEDFE